MLKGRNGILSTGRRDMKKGNQEVFRNTVCRLWRPGSGATKLHNPRGHSLLAVRGHVVPWSCEAGCSKLTLSVNSFCYELGSKSIHFQ